MAITTPITITRAQALPWVLLLAAAWILPGLIGHEPWKPDEAYTFGVILELLRGGSWVVPHLAGQAMPEEPPLYHLLAAASGRLLSGVLPPHDGARLFTGLLMAGTLAFIERAASELYGRNRGWLSVVLLVSCVGLLIRGHQMIPDLGMLLGLAVALYGLALAPRRERLAGLWLGLGLGFVFMCEGVIEAALLAIVALAMAAFTPWRTRAYLATLGVAALVALPWLSIWPWLLYQQSPALFEQWLWTFNLERFFGTAAMPFAGRADYYLRIILWYTFPTLPLAAWVTWGARHSGWGSAGIALPLVAFAAMLLGLSLAADVRELYTLPLLLPLALLANPAIGTLRRGAGNALYWFAVMAFTVFLLAGWFYWSALELGLPVKLHDHLHRIQPGYDGGLRPWHIAWAALLTIAWFALVWNLKRGPERPLLAWAGGMTLVWGVAVALFQPWADVGKSYRATIAQLATAVPKRHICIAQRNLGDPQRAMLDYYAQLRTVRESSLAGEKCDVLLVQGYAREESPVPGGWIKIWEGARPGDKTEKLRLYQRRTSAKP
jgi:4-amino-4-deoxy-L-arabinose transferase-like glycosyltransferase